VIQSIPSAGGATGGSVGGASSLTTAGAIPYVSSSGVLDQAPLISYKSATANLLIGDTTEKNYKLLVAKSGSAGTVSVIDLTATTGATLVDVGFDGTNVTATSTKVRIRGGTGQGGARLLELYDSAGSLEQGWAVGAAYLQYVGGNIISNQAAGNYNLASGKYVGFSSAVNLSGGNLIDVAIGRNAAGVLEIDSGTAGQYRDLILRRSQHSGVAVSALPAAAAGNAGSMQYVTDANATTISSVVAGGGANKVLVWSDGTNWKIFAN